LEGFFFNTFLYTVESVMWLCTQATLLFIFERCRKRQA
jgi:hypothetical protein